MNIKALAARLDRLEGGSASAGAFHLVTVPFGETKEAASARYQQDRPILEGDHVIYVLFIAPEPRLGWPTAEVIPIR